MVNALYRLQGTGIPRIAEFVRKSWAKSHRDYEIVIDNFCGDLKFTCSLREHMGSQIYWRGSYSGDQLDLLANLLQPGDNFVDLGANQGEFTILAAKLVGEEGQVYAFEPSPTMRQRLTGNIGLNKFSNVQVEHYAVASQSGRMNLFSPSGEYKDGTKHEGLPTLYEPEHGQNSVCEVEVITLDCWRQMRGVERIDLIKMDIEGAELPALQGGKGLIEEFRPALLIELNEATSRSAGYKMLDLTDWLTARGYELNSVDENGVLRPLETKTLASFQNIFARIAE